MPPKARTAADKVWKDTTEFSLIVSLKSRTGRSFTDKGLRVTRQNLEYFIPDAKTHAEARRELEREGFKLLAQSRLGLSIRGPKKLIQEFFQAEIDVHRMAARRHGKLLKTRVPQGRLTVPPKLSPLIDSVIFDLYPTPLESATPPAAGYYHLGVPGDVAEILGASQLHPCGFDGSGIKLCMVDDGFFSHAYYATRGYDITLVPVVEEVMPPSTGHGTAIASNALAVAPGVEFLFANMYDADENSVLLAALRRAKDQNPDIITCSWGIKCPLMYPDLGPLTWEIADAVNNGVVVVFACGNDGPVHFPGCMDEVISVGGVFPEEGGGFHAATYASSGECSVNSGRQCPDVCGLVGDRPAGVLIMMPTVPGGYYDDLFASEDATTVDDGWLCASGTSSAAPQVAGLAALLLQCDPTLAPDEVKAILQNTAKDITAGSSASGQAAGPGVDLATGYGLVDAVAAMEAAGCTCVPCEDYCETSCTTFCRANCMTTCETGEIADCKAQCQPFSEPCVPKCDSSCVTFCQGGCITIREGQCSKCEPACMIKCEGACLAGCEPGCMTMCEGRCMTGCVVGGCQVGCMGICEGGGCQLGCQTMCEGKCMAGCVVGGCQLGCQTICEGGCTNIRIGGGCNVGCMTVCEGGHMGGCLAGRMEGCLGGRMGGCLGGRMGGGDIIPIPDRTEVVKRGVEGEKARRAPTAPASGVHTRRLTTTPRVVPGKTGRVVPSGGRLTPIAAKRVARMGGRETPTRGVHTRRLTAAPGSKVSRSLAYGEPSTEAVWVQCVIPPACTLACELTGIVKTMCDYLCQTDCEPYKAIERFEWQTGCMRDCEIDTLRRPEPCMNSCEPGRICPPRRSGYRTGGRAPMPTATRGVHTRRLTTTATGKVGGPSPRAYPAPGPGCEHDCEQICILCEGPCTVQCQSGCQGECQTVCELACQASCEVQCMVVCEGQCMTSCESGCMVICMGRCMAACESGCMTVCESGCMVVCQGRCMTICEAGCMTVCQGGCMTTCEAACMMICEGGCMSACVSLCMTVCEAGCMMVCEHGRIVFPGCIVKIENLVATCEMHAFNPYELSEIEDLIEDPRTTELQRRRLSELAQTHAPGVHTRRLTTTRRPTAQPARRVGTYRQPVSRRGGTYAAGRPRTRGVTGTGKTGFPAGTRACLYCETYRQATRERDRAGASEESCRSSCDAGFCTTTCMVECEMKCMPKCETGQCEVSCMTSIEPERQK